MNLYELFEVEIEGITDTINEYAVEKYIRSYTKQLKCLNPSHDGSKIRYMIAKLLEWYESHIEDINRSLFVPNKDEHKRSFRLLSELKEGLS